MTGGRFGGICGTGGGAKPRFSLGGAGASGRGPNRTGFVVVEGGGPSGGVTSGFD